MWKNFQPYEKWMLILALVSFVLFVSIHIFYEFGADDLLYTILLTVGFFTSSSGIAIYFYGRFLDIERYENRKRRNR